MRPSANCRDCILSAIIAAASRWAAASRLQRNSPRALFDAQNLIYMHTHEHSDEDLLVSARSRTRRTRMTEMHRRLVRETSLEPRNFILPMFAVEGDANFRKPIASMPGVDQLGIDGILRLSEQ